MKVVLDTNIYDILYNDNETRNKLSSLIKHGKWIVMAPVTLVEELNDSPFGGVPDWLQVEKELDSVFIFGHSKLDCARLGSGEIYSEHRGKSNKIKDSVIVDFAVNYANIFVSEDNRSIKRLALMQKNIEIYKYAEFKEKVVKECEWKT